MLLVLVRTLVLGITASSIFANELNITESFTELNTEVVDVENSANKSLVEDKESCNGTLDLPSRAELSRTFLPGVTVRSRATRRRARRGRRPRSFGDPRYRGQGQNTYINPYNLNNPYYRRPQGYYDVYYNPYQGYYPEYSQPGYYPGYPYAPQQYPQAYPQPQPYYQPPQPVAPSPPPTLAPIPDLYYVQHADTAGHYQYRKISVTRRPREWPQQQQPGYYGSPYDTYNRRPPPQDYRYPRRPAAPSIRPFLTLTYAPVASPSIYETTPGHPPGISGG